MPKISLMGAGSLNDLASEIKDLELPKVLIVTDKVLIKVRIADNLIKILKGAGQVKKPMTPLICVNTRAGTASELP